MFGPVLIATLLAVPAAPPVGLVGRAEKTDLRRSDGSAVSRVERNTAGDPTGLLLNDMQLTPAEVADFGRLPELRRVVLFRTNVGDGDLKHLAKCPHLEGLNLVGTGVTDEAVPALLELKALKYLCLGDVRMSPEAVAKLKEGFRARGQSVRVGYSRRKE
jgi:hypothetical protein